MDVIFTDKFNRSIRLPKERIKHIYKHPEMQNKLHLVREAIEKPQFIEKDLYRRKVFYYKYIKEERKYVMVVVKITNNHGYILTAYLVGK